MMTHQERNQQIVWALAVTYIAWTVLWTPHMLFDVVTTFKYLDWFGRGIPRSEKGWQENHFNFVKNLTASFGLMYSTVTPVIFVVLIRPFQELLVHLYIRLKRKSTNPEKSRNKLNKS